MRKLLTISALAVLAGAVTWSTVSQADVEDYAGKKIVKLEGTTVPSGSSSTYWPIVDTTGFEAALGDGGWNAGVGVCGPEFASCVPPNVNGPCAKGLGPSGPVGSDLNCCGLNPNNDNGWWISPASTQCHQPHIDTIHPSTGSQHVRFMRDAAVPGSTACCGTAAGNSLYTPDMNGLSRHPYTISFDISGSALFGPTLQLFSFDNLELLPGYVYIVSHVRFDPYGYIRINHPASSAVPPPTGFSWIADGAYREFRIESSPCPVCVGGSNDGGVCGEGAPCSGCSADRFCPGGGTCSTPIEYYYNGTLVKSGNTLDMFGNGTYGPNGDKNELTRFVMNNASGGVFDLDNYLIDRGPNCPPASCGNDITESGEDCDGADDVFCPGRCDSNCECDRVCDPFAFYPGTPDQNDLCDLNNGDNGPYLTSAGFYFYTADTPFTSFNSCGSTYDTWIYVYEYAPGFGYIANSQNDDCNAGTFGANSDPSASCFAQPGEDLASCTCIATTPGYTYLVVANNFGGSPAGHLTSVSALKKNACGDPIIGACCNHLTGTCTDDVAQANCADPIQNVWYFNKPCSLVPPCDIHLGACCNTSPESGPDGGGPLGACQDGVALADCPPGPQQSWSKLSTCTQVGCFEATGSCCDHSPQAGGDPGPAGDCTDDVLSADCPDDVQHTWMKLGDCATVSCLETRGACCDMSPGAGGPGASGACTDDVLEADCPDDVQHAWTKGALCADVTCNETPGACCNRAPGAAGDCDDGVLQADCVGSQLVWTKAASCSQVNCQEARGSCCDLLAGTCTENQLQSQCSGPQREWRKDTLCAAAGCAAVRGACCNADFFGGCTDDLTLAECNACPGGKCTWFKLQNCSDSTVTCELNEIPTVSEWGLAMMTLLLLIGAKVYFGRRQAAAA